MTIRAFLDELQKRMLAAGFNLDRQMSMADLGSFIKTMTEIGSEHSDEFPMPDEQMKGVVAATGRAAGKATVEGAATIVDHSALLVHYMAHVIVEEGVSFVETAYITNLATKFSEGEIAELQKLQIEAKRLP